MKAFKPGQIVLFDIWREFRQHRNLMCIIAEYHKDNSNYVLLSPFLPDKEAVTFSLLNFWKQNNAEIIDYLRKRGGTDMCYNVHIRNLKPYKRTVTEQCMHYVKHNIQLDENFCTAVNASIRQTKRRTNAAKRA